ncbi:Flp family type IVb pilin [uncultured Eubacterium sp.]|nr:Flp family type IVb pilin [uncultured Eubacterium sp.]HAH19189.1 Flp family type IVb pilin [Eubacterium sp.]HAV90986.1 Flp family type IVb pilin [Eubacterium sp.]
MRKMLDFLKDENGQGMVEYGLIIALIAIVVIAALTILGPKIAALFNKVNEQVNS